MANQDLIAARVQEKAKRARKRSKPQKLSQSTPDQQDRSRATRVTGPPAPTAEQKRNQRARDELERRARTYGPAVPTPKTQIELRDEDQQSAGGLHRKKEEQRHNRAAIKRARKAVETLYDPKATEPKKTSARQRLAALGAVSGDSVGAPDAGDKHDVIRRYVVPGAISHPFERDSSGREKRIYDGDPAGYTQERDKTLDRFLAKAVSKVSGRIGIQNPDAMSRAGFGPNFSKSFNKAAKRGLMAGGHGVLEGLVRPGQAVESTLGKALVKTGAIKDDRVTDLGHKISKARGPLEVLSKGRGDEGVTGGDITAGLGGPKSAGIAVDFATDPLMWLGVGALEKGTQKTAAALAHRIEASGTQEAKEALRGIAVTRAAERAANSGDAEPLLGALRKIADEHGVSTRAIGSTRAERGAKKAEGQKMAKARVEESRQVLQDLRTGHGAGEVSLKGRNLYVPDVAGQEAIKSVARLAKQRELRPGVRLRLLDPLGREHGSVPLPVPKRLANARVVPVLSKNSKKALAEVRLAERAHGEVTAHNAALGEVAAQRKDLSNKLMKRTKEVSREQAHAELGPVRDQLDSMEEELKLSMKRRLITAKDQEVEAAKVGLTQSPAELFTRKNVRRLNRAVGPTADEFGRTTQMRFYQEVLKGIEDHLGNLNDPKIVKSLEKIQLHRFARSDTGSQSVLKKANVKLTPAEQSVMKELDLVDAQMAKFGQATGTLGQRSKLEDYGGPRIWDPEGTSVDKIVQNINSRLGASGFFAKHRSQSAVSDLADPERLANTLSRLSDDDMDVVRARSHADEWHQTAQVRNAQELMMRQEQRAGDTLNMDDLPPTFKRAAHLSESMTPRGSESEVPLLNIDKSSGVAKLNRSEAAQRGYGQPTRDPLDTTPEQAIKSIDADLTRIVHIRKTTKSGTQYDKDLRKWARRLRVQKAALSHEMHAGRADREGGMGELSDLRTEGLMADEREILDQLAEYPGDTHLQNELKKLRDEMMSLEARTAGRDARADEFEPDDILGNPLPGQNSAMERDIDKILQSPGGNPFDDVVGDVTSRLPDFRESDFFPILDMRNSYFYRTRSEGVNVAFRSRWKGIDEAEGRNKNETESLYRAGDGSEGRVDDLEQWEVPDGREAQVGADPEAHTFWYDRRTEKVYDIDEIKTTGPALVPNSDHTTFWDINTKRQYAYPHQVSAAVGERIDAVIQPVGKDGVVNRTRVWPTDVIHAADMEAKRAGEYDVVFKTGMESALGKVLSQMRYGVTSLWPAYHWRNMISDLLKSLQADSGVMFHPLANAKLASTAFRQGKGGDITIKGLGTMPSEDFLLMADAFGLRSGHHVAEVSRIAETGEFPVRGRASRSVRALGPSGAVGSKAVDFGVRREDMTRFITFAQRMRQNGGDAADAMMYMVKHHFNYNDLTIYEKRVIRNLFLFYTWYRKNIPLQLAELVHRPGFMSGVAHSYRALEEGETPVNQDWSKINPMFPDMSGEMPRRGTIPDYLQDRLQSAGVNWNGHAAMFGFGAPWADLSLLKASPEGLRDWAAMMNPAITTGLQLADKRDLLTGRDLKQSEAGGPPNAVDAVMKALNLGELPTDKKGNPVLPWALTVVLRNTVPGLGRLFGTFETPSTQRDPGLLQRIGKQGAAIHGINVYVSPGKGTTREELAITNQVRGRAAERGEVLKNISNLPQGEATKRVAEFDRKTLIWAKQHDIPMKYLKAVKATGYYVGKQREPAGSGLGGGGLGGGLGGGGLGG